jgi:Tol biopolymer transport system component
MVNQGNGFTAGTPVRREISRQGDPMLSPSGSLLVTRMKGQEFNTSAGGFDLVAAEQSGYALYTVDTSSGAPSLADAGHICMQGGKATFSFDERWMVFHHYVLDGDAVDLGFSGPDDQNFSDYQELGSSNLYLVDLKTGDIRRFTNMPAGQFALFPHFRSDGWIYFVVRTLEGNEYFAATDAALVLESGG